MPLVPSRRAVVRGFALAAVAAAVLACTPREDPATTPLPTRQTTIDPVKGKLDAAQQDAEKRRADADRAGQ
jgi:hypothetical protein